MMDFEQPFDDNYGIFMDCRRNVSYDEHTRPPPPYIPIPIERQRSLPPLEDSHHGTKEKMINIDDDLKDKIICLLFCIIVLQFILGSDLETSSRSRYLPPRPRAPIPRKLRALLDSYMYG